MVSIDGIAGVSHSWWNEQQRRPSMTEDMDYEVQFDEVRIIRQRGRYAIVIRRDNGNRATIWDDEGVAEELFLEIVDRYDDLMEDVIHPILEQCTDPEDSQ